MAGFADAVHAYELFDQGRSAANTPGAIRAFTAGPSVQTAFSLGGNLVGVIGTERVVGGLVKFGVKMALRARESTADVAEEMVELMRSRVPQDDGRLFHGIMFEVDENGVATVEASAINPRDTTSSNYAFMVEFGTEDTPAQPFFYNSAEEVLAKRGQTLEQAMARAASEEGLT